MELTGLAQSIFLSRCDFNPAFQLGYAHGSPAGGTAYFAGADTESFGALGTVTPPAELAPGQVSCYLNVVSPGFYFFVAQVYTDVDGKGYTATIECSIDTFSFDTTTLFGGGASTYRVFAVELSAGLHRFGIKRVTGGIYFESLTAWVVHPTR